MTRDCVLTLNTLKDEFSILRFIGPKTRKIHANATWQQPAGCLIFVHPTDLKLNKSKYSTSTAVTYTGRYRTTLS